MYRLVVLCATVLFVLAVCHPAGSEPVSKLDAVLQQRATLLAGSSPIIARPLNNTVDLLIQSLGGTLGRALPIVNGRAADVPNTVLSALAASAAVERVAFDRPTVGSMERTAQTIGATAVRQQFGYDGSGIGIALIDSGIAPHDDLSGASLASQRVDGFVDFVNNLTVPYDDLGHGTHVAGIVAGNGYDSTGARAGIAPAARLLVLKVLDGSGAGRISNVIAALDYIASHRTSFNIRVVNVSIGAAVTESYTSDLLAQATKNVVDQGVVVVVAAGNNGRRSGGGSQYGGIMAPGNAPWVLTVGASSHMGTVDRGDDTVAPFSSRGPTAIDHLAKPDLVAPGVGIESLSVPHSQLASTFSGYLLNGTVPTAFPPYLSLTGTSMAAPVATGTVALMLQANPALTPSAVKAILEFTAEAHAEYDPLTQGAGFLNASGAVSLARYFANPTSTTYPTDASWAGHIMWANHLLSGGRVMPGVNAWATSTGWGSDQGSDGQAIVWGDAWSNGSAYENVVWGSTCGGADCPPGTWYTSDGDTIVWGTSDGDTIVWGTNCGTECDDR
jgi:serine protease AprX